MMLLGVGHIMKRHLKLVTVSRSHADILFVQLAMSTGVNSDTAQTLTSPQGGWGTYRGGGGGRGGRGELTWSCDRYLHLTGWVM